MDKSRSIIKSVLDIYRTSLVYISSRASDFGVGRGQWYFFNRLLLGEDGVTQERLSEEMFVDSAHTTRALKKLEEDGFIRREPDSHDMRKKTVYVTDKAISIKEDYHGLYKDLNSILLKDFTPEEKEAVIELMSRIRGNIVEHVSKKGG